MSSYRIINQVQDQFLPFLGSLDVRCVWHTALRPSHSRLMLGSSASAHLTFLSPCSISTISLHPGCPCRSLGFCPPCYPSKVCSVPAPSLDGLLWVVGTKHPGETVSACPEQAILIHFSRTQRYATRAAQPGFEFTDHLGPATHQSPHPHLM